MLYNLYLDSVHVLFSSPSVYAKVFFTEKHFTLVSFIFCVPQEKTFVMIDNMAGQFNTIALEVNDVSFFCCTSYMSPFEADIQRLCTAVTL